MSRSALKIEPVHTLPFLTGRSVSSPPVAPFGDYGEEVPPEALEQLSFEQKLALCQASNRISVNAVYQAMRDKLSREGSQVPPFTGATFARLRELGLAERRSQQRYHSLTLRGAQVADLVARNLVKEFRLHSSWLGGAAGATVTLHCTCGWSCALARGTNMQLKAALAQSHHLNTIAAMNGIAEALAPKGKPETPQDTQSA